MSTPAAEYGNLNAARALVDAGADVIQVTRSERDIYSNIRLMLEASGRNVPPLNNVPNRYLQPKSNA